MVSWEQLMFNKLEIAEHLRRIEMDAPVRLCDGGGAGAEM